MGKSAKSVSIIGGADGPTSVFLVGQEEKNIFKRFQRYITDKKYKRKRRKVEKTIVPGAHTIEETIQYMKQRYEAVEADHSYPYYEERKEDLRYARMRREKPELFSGEEIIPKPKDFGDEQAVREWFRRIEEQNEVLRNIAREVSDEMFPTDYHLFLIDKGKQGKIEMETDTFSSEIHISYSGEKKTMEPILRDIYRYHGVSQEDIDHKTERYQSLLAVLSC